MTVKRKLLITGRRKKKGVQALLTASALLAASLAGAVDTVYAASPPFAYSDEKWASLKDNNLEFDEIADLIHEYNSTVIQNQIDYKDYKGKDKDEIAQTYYDTADEIYSSLDYPDTDDESYGSKLASAQTSELQADQMMEKGDENVSDGEIIKLGYDKTELSLVQSAQELMITYHSTLAQLESLKNTRDQAQKTYETTAAKAAAGTATESMVLSAQKNVLNAEASITSAESTLAETKESLCLMLGWNYGSAVTIGGLPEPDVNAAASINLEEDLTKAAENNYDLKILRKQIKNATVGTAQREYEEELKSGEQAVAANVKNSYQNLLLAKNKYDQALQSLSLEEKTKASADRKLSAGTISQTTYQSQIASYESASVEVTTAALSLLKAQLSYSWAVSGLARTT